MTDIIFYCSYDGHKDGKTIERVSHTVNIGDGESSFTIISKGKLQGSMSANVLLSHTSLKLCSACKK